MRLINCYNCGVSPLPPLVALEISMGFRLCGLYEQTKNSQNKSNDGLVSTKVQSNAGVIYTYNHRREKEKIRVMSERNGCHDNDAYCRDFNARWKSRDNFA